MNKKIKCFECCYIGDEFDTSVYTKQEIKCKICGAPYAVKVYKKGPCSIRRTDRKDYRKEFHGIAK